MLRRQRGISLVELMIAMVLGLLVSAIVIGMFSSTVGSTRQAITTIRLNQELRTVMDLMIRDLRRSGYWEGTTAASNPYASITVAGAPVAVFQSSGDAGHMTSTTAGDSGECVILGYDSDSSGASVAERLIGYRYDAGQQAVEGMWTDDTGTIGLPAGCDVANSYWNNLTDETAVCVTTLQFTPDPSPASFAAATVRNLVVTISAESCGDNRIKSELTDQVRIRNDL